MNWKEGVRAMNKPYFKYLARSYKYLIVFFFAIYFSLSILYAMPSDAYFRTYEMCTIAGILSACACYVLPIILFSFVHKRSSADVYHGLPISRKEHRITILLFSFAVIFGYFLLTCLFGYLVYGIGTVRILSVLAMLGYMAFTILTLLCVNSALYLLGNNILDGLVILAAYTLFFLPCALAESIIAERMVAGTSTFLSAPIAQLLSPAVILLRNFLNLASYHSGIQFGFSILYLVIAAVYLVLGWFGLKQEFDERKSERAEAISDHPLAYPTVINMYAIVLLLVIGSGVVTRFGTDAILAYLAVLICYTAGTFLYRRKIQIDLKRTGIFVLEAVITLALMWVCWKTKGFGMAYQYSLNRGYVLNYEYSAAVEESDLGKHYVYEQNVYVHFTLYFSTDELDRYPELIDLLEKKRHEAIESFYRQYEDYSVSLRVYNREKYDDSIVNDYTYHPEVLFTEEELKYISQYTDVIVQDYGNYEVWEGNEVSLEDFLSWRNKKN